jgi:hypothetical protein
MGLNFMFGSIFVRVSLIPDDHLVPGIFFPMKRAIMTCSLYPKFNAGGNRKAG